jgi:hypothetical protein
MNFGEVSLACVAFVGLQIAPVYAENVKRHDFKK